jgi:hypothetical protein
MHACAHAYAGSVVKHLIIICVVQGFTKNSERSKHDEVCGLVFSLQKWHDILTHYADSGWH